MVNLDPFGIFSSPEIFVLVLIAIGAMAGAVSRKLSLAAFGGIIIFTHIVIETDLFIYDAVLYVVLAIVLLYATIPVVSSYLESGESESIE